MTNFKLHLVQRGIIDFYQTCLQAFNPFGLDVGTTDFVYNEWGRGYCCLELKQILSAIKSSITNWPQPKTSRKMAGRLLKASSRKM